MRHAVCQITMEYGKPMSACITGPEGPGVTGRFPLDGENFTPAGEAGGWQLPAADEVLNARGYLRISEWEEDEVGDLSAEIKTLTEISLDIGRMFRERAAEGATEATGEVLAAIQAGRYGYARALLGKVGIYLEVLERAGGIREETAPDAPRPVN